MSVNTDAADADRINGAHGERATKTTANRVDLLLLGKGTVGSQLLLQMEKGRAALLARHHVDLRLVGVVDTRASVFDARGIAPPDARARLETCSSKAPIDVLIENLTDRTIAIVVDCTAASGMNEVYEKAFTSGAHVVTANKKPFALPQHERNAMFRSAEIAGRELRYETTVGASLPVIETLQNLVRTGDEIIRIEGSLSGTLGYLSNEVSRGVALSRAVRAARDSGYTEPHPRDDLSGLDVARKALILAREIGYELDLGDIAVEPFLPHAVLEHEDLETFFDAVASHDAPFERHLEGLRKEHKVLRYMATIMCDSSPGETRSARVRVGPVGVFAEHPAARLRGTEALVAFSTERYHETPLVIQGAGAGGAVTAAGVLADILAIARGYRTK